MTKFDFLDGPTESVGLSEEDVAYHEAGHAVAMVLFEIRFEEIYLHVYEGNSEKMVMGATIWYPHLSVVAPQELVVVLHCGILAATKRQNPEVVSKNLPKFFTESLKRGAGTDLDRADSIRKKCEAHGLFDKPEFEHDISEVIDRQWPAIYAVAERLLYSKKLIGEEVIKIVSASRGPFRGLRVTPI